MTEIQSYTFDFTEPSRFFDNWNVRFKTMEMNGGNNYQLVLSNYSPSNFDECVDGGGVLNSDVTVLTTLNCPLSWDGEKVSIASDVEYNIGTSTTQTLKAVFLKNKNTGYVLGYCIFANSITVTNKVIFEEGTVLYTISNSRSDG